MRSVRFVFRSIKNTIIGFLGGDCSAKSAFLGVPLIAIYYFALLFIVVLGNNDWISGYEAGAALVALTLIYPLVLTLGALLFDFIWHKLLKK